VHNLRIAFPDMDPLETQDRLARDQWERSEAFARNSRHGPA
jgi:hypothetical protein